MFAATNLGVLIVLVLVCYFALQHLVRSPWGRVLRALREDEDAAKALGKDPVTYRLQAFAIGGFVMGLGGAAQAHFIGFIAPDNYLPTLTFQVWTMLIVGGSGNMRGAILGAVLVWAIWAVSGSVVSSVFPADQTGAGRLIADRAHWRGAVPCSVVAPAWHSWRGRHPALALAAGCPPRSSLSFRRTKDPWLTNQIASILLRAPQYLPPRLRPLAGCRP